MEWMKRSKEIKLEWMKTWRDAKANRGKPKYLPCWLLTNKKLCGDQTQDQTIHTSSVLEVFISIGSLLCSFSTPFLSSSPLLLLSSASLLCPSTLHLVYSSKFPSTSPTVSIPSHPRSTIDSFSYSLVRHSSKISNSQHYTRNNSLQRWQTSLYYLTNMR
jgi:hypothetical protein